METKINSFLACALIVVVGAAAALAINNAFRNFDFPVQVNMKASLSLGKSNNGSADTQRKAQAAAADSDWKTYKNNELGFEMSYPQAFQLKELDRKRKSFDLSDGSEHFELVVDENTLKRDAGEIKESYYENDDSGIAYEDSYVNVGGVNSYKQGRYDDNSVVENYFIPSRGKVFKFTFEFAIDPASKNAPQDAKQSIQQVMGSFKLIDEPM